MKCKFRVVNPKTNHEKTIETDVSTDDIAAAAKSDNYNVYLSEVLAPVNSADSLLIGNSLRAAAAQ